MCNVLYICSSCPENVYITNLKVENVKFICEFWKYRKLENRIRYFQRLIKQRFVSVGVFLKGNPTQPVSWALCAEIGHIRHVYTLAEHRRKGYAKIAVLAVMKKMLEAGITPELEVYTAEDPESVAAVKLFTELGFVESYSAVRKQYGM